MKKMIMMGAVLLLAGVAQADDEMKCRDVNAGPDHGYYIRISGDLTSAQVSEQTFAGPRILANLVCSPQESRIQHPDQMVTIARCREPETADAGYSVVVRSGGFTGITMATLSEVTFFGTEQVASLLCR